MSDYIPRKLDGTLLEFMESEQPGKPVLLVEGARQVGKTRFVENAMARCAKKTIYMNLEKDSLMRSRIDECRQFSDFQDLLEDECGFTSGTPVVVCIDEAQESSSLGKFVRFMKEDWPLASVVLTGSSMTRLFRADTRYPVGRVQRLILRPFSFSEYLRANALYNLADVVLEQEPTIGAQRHETILGHFDRYLQRGGLPEVVMAGDPKKAERLRSRLIADYEQDFIRVFGESDLHIVKACFRSVARFVGGPSKNTSVIPNPGSTVNARINDVFSRLESWHFVLRSDQSGPSPEAGHRYLPKRYMFDSGVLRHFREVAVPPINIIATLNAAARSPLGGVIENQTALAIASMEKELCGWKKSSDGMEIDFVVKGPRSPIPIECKASLKNSKRQIKGLVRYMSEFGVDTGFIVSLAPYSIMELERGGRIINLPTYNLEALNSFI